MAQATTTNPADFTNRTQTLFNPKLLEALVLSLKLARFGLSEGYSAIGDTIRFFRPRKASLAGINAQALTGLSITPLTTPTVLTEGVKPTNLTEVGIGYVDIKMTQRAGYAELTDRLQAIDLINTLKVYSETMGKDAALDYDTVCRNWLVSGLFGSNATYAGAQGGYFERFAGVAPTGVSADDFGTLVGASKANGKMTRLANLAVATQMKTALIPKLNDKYVCLTTPEVVHDIRQDNTWVQTGTYQAKDQLFKDMAIELDGVVFIEQNNPFTEAAVYGTESQTDPGDGLVYSNIYLGKDAFGVPNLSNAKAGGTQQAPKLIILNQADKADPINQKTTIGWKSFFGAAAFITNVTGERPRYTVLRTKSTFI